MKSNSKSSVRTPSSVFKSCPHCESPNVVSFEGDVICTYCGWDSIGLRIDAKFSVRQREDGNSSEVVMMNSLGPGLSYGRVS